MKVKLEDALFEFLTDNTQEVNKQTALLKTSQNSHYIDEEVIKNAHSIVEVKDVSSYFGLNRIKVVGITGTNGKTTTAAAIYSILLDLGYGVAMQGTRGFFVNDMQKQAATLTTPSVLNTLVHIYQAVQESCEFFVMEVSSHAISQNRIEGIEFALKILTNITGDHLDYHKTLQEYIDVKNSFFADESMKLINRDESNALFNFKNAYTYAIESGASFKLIAYSLKEGISAAVQFFSQTVPFYSSMHGHFNVYNLLAAVAAVKLLTNKELEDICEQTKNFAGVSGRMEVVNKSPLVIVDFAHTPDGVAQVLEALQGYDLRVVLGAGGDRDRQKRPIMGKIAHALAKKVYITSDNPRFEDPNTIIDDILKGIEDTSQVYINANRKEAIKQALIDQNGDEAVVILGKGDEPYQILYDQKLPFDDREVARALLKELGKHDA